MRTFTVRCWKPQCGVLLNVQAGAAADKFVTEVLDAGWDVILGSGYFACPGHQGDPWQQMIAAKTAQDTPPRERLLHDISPWGPPAPAVLPAPGPPWPC